MKTRNGFVSNSSSSSFVIALKPSAKQPCPTCGCVDATFLNILEHAGYRGYSCDDTALHCKGAQEVYEYFQKGCYIDEYKKYWSDMLAKMLELEKNGDVIAYIEISYHDEEFNDTLNRLRHNKQLAVLWADNEGTDGLDL